MNENKKQKTITIKLRTIIIAIVVLTSALLISNAYATTNGYDNIFFMIKEKVLGQPQETSGKEALLSDRDITISYTSIEVAEKIKIQIQRILLEKDNATLFVRETSEDGEVLEQKMPLKYKLYNSDNELIGDKSTKEEGFIYSIKTNKPVKETETLKLEIFDKTEKLLSTILINLKNKELTLNGETIEIEKQSEAELKKYLSAFSLLTFNTQNTNFDVLNSELIFIAGRINNEILNIEDGTKRENVHNTIKAFWNKDVEMENGIIVTNRGDEGCFVYNEEIDGYIGAGRKFADLECIEITDISYTDKIYTVKYIFINRPYGEATDFTQYEATIKLKLNEDITNSKYKIVEISENVQINNSNDNNNTQTEEDLQISASFEDIISEYETAIRNKDFAPENHPNLNTALLRHANEVIAVKPYIDGRAEGVLLICDKVHTVDGPHYNIIDLYIEKNDQTYRLSNNSLGDRSHAYLYDNNVLIMKGSNSASSGVYKFYDLVSKDLLGQYFYEYTDSDNVNIYSDSNKTNKLEYTSIDEVIQIYLINTTIINLNHQHIIPIGSLNDDGTVDDEESTDVELLSNKQFCVEEIKENENDYTLTVYVLKDNPRVLTNDEYLNLKDGGEIEFRKMKWKLEDLQTVESTLTVLVSGDSKLNISNSGKTISNIAGKKKDLSDYEKKVTFNVPKDLLIGAQGTDFEIESNGNVKVKTYSHGGDENVEPTLISFERLNELSQGCRGGYEECKAFIENGEVKAIRIFD